MSTLTDPSVQKSIADFISEAKQCARRGNGFAAMSTIFNVVLAVSEAVFQSNSNIEHLENFVPEMTNQTRWLVTTGHQPTNSDVAELLTDVRNGFAHALSMPPHTTLKNNRNEAVSHARLAAMTSSGIQKCFISVIDFVEDVEATASKLSANNPNCLFDPGKGQRDRKPARGYSLHNPP